MVGEYLPTKGKVGDDLMKKGLRIDLCHTRTDPARSRAVDLSCDLFNPRSGESTVPPFESYLEEAAIWTPPSLCANRYERLNDGPCYI